MQWVASGFLFVRGRSVVHRLDPRTRLLISLSLFANSLLSRSITELVVVIVTIVALSVVARIAKRYARSMVFTGLIALAAFVANFLFFPQPLAVATLLALRLFAVIGSTSVFFLTTTPDELEGVMRWFKLPPDFIMVFVIAVRFVPVLLLDSFQIMDAQRSRGLEFEKGSILRRIQSAIPILVPLLAVAVTRSLDLAEAMDSRAYGARPRPTSLHKLALVSLDYYAIFPALLLAGGGVYAALFLHLF